MAIHESNPVFAMSHLGTLFQTVGAQGADPWGFHGCVRPSSDDAGVLFDWAPMGTVVAVKA